MEQNRIRLMEELDRRFVKHLRAVAADTRLQHQVRVSAHDVERIILDTTHPLHEPLRAFITFKLPVVR